jgi:regulator of sigma E protease
MNSLLISLVAVAVVLGVVVLVHEWGHFIAAKIFGVGVVVFSFGYGSRLFGWKRGGTDYRVSALPLGGYVRLAGDNPVEDRTGSPDEFLSRPRWQRVLIYCAGPFMNFVLALVVATGIFLFLGIPVPVYMTQPVTVAAVPAQSNAELAGLKPEDHVVKIANIENPTWEQAYTYLAQATPGSAVALEVERGGQRLPLTVKMADAHEVERTIGDPLLPPIISEVAAGMPADRAGIRADDRVVSIDGQKVVTWPQLQALVQASHGGTLHLTVLRNGEEKQFELQAVRGQAELGQPDYLIGAQRVDPVVYRPIGTLPAIRAGGTATLAMMAEVLNIVKELITGRVSIKQLQSVVGITHESGQAARRGPVDFISWLAIISVNLGVLNLLPIPILDGGHILLLGIEGALRRDLSLAVKERIVQVGVVFLLVIFAIVMYNDVARFVPHH